MIHFLVIYQRILIILYEGISKNILGLYEMINPIIFPVHLEVIGFGCRLGDFSPDFPF